jgi:hypothetical protein
MVESTFLRPSIVQNFSFLNEASRTRSIRETIAWSTASDTFLIDAWKASNGIVLVSSKNVNPGNNRFILIAWSQRCGSTRRVLNMVKLWNTEVGPNDPLGRLQFKKRASSASEDVFHNNASCVSAKNRSRLQRDNPSSSEARSTSPWCSKAARIFIADSSPTMRTRVTKWSKRSNLGSPNVCRTLLTNPLVRLSPRKGFCSCFERATKFFRLTKNSTPHDSCSPFTTSPPPPPPPPPPPTSSRFGIGVVDMLLGPQSPQQRCRMASAVDGASLPTPTQHGRSPSLKIK